MLASLLETFVQGSTSSIFYPKMANANGSGGLHAIAFLLPSSLSRPAAHTNTSPLDEMVAITGTSP